VPFDLKNFDLNSFIVAIIFLLPGFLFLKSKTLIFPTSNKDFSKKIIEIFLYSCLHFLIVALPIYIWLFKSMQLSHIGTYSLLILVYIVIPILSSFIFKYVLELKFVKERIVSPVERPWEVFFLRREPVWVIIYLKNGRNVIGTFGEESSASSSLGDEQIYLEKLYELNDDFIPVEIPNTKGGIFSKDCWEYIEFLNDPAQEA
jgi:hypothetical protein